VKAAGQRDFKGLWVQDVYSQWYRVDHFNDVVDSRVVDLSVYDFAEEPPVSHHLSSYSVRDLDSDALMCFTAVVEQKAAGHQVLSGELQPNADRVSDSSSSSSSLVPLQVTVHVKCYTVYPGVREGDADFGLWFIDFGDEWFQPRGACHPEYAQLDARRCELVSGYKLMIDAFLHRDLCDLTPVRNSAAICHHSIRRTHALCGEHFSLAFVAANRDFVARNLAERVVGEGRASRAFFDSIQALGTANEVLEKKAHKLTKNAVKRQDSDKASLNAVASKDLRSAESDSAQCVFKQFRRSEEVVGDIEFFGDDRYAQAEKRGIQV
jgi:hypothetical protein